jgi:hypothetical protein
MATPQATPLPHSPSKTGVNALLLALDCFAEPVIGPATSGRTRWLAMTVPYTSGPGLGVAANDGFSIRL